MQASYALELHALKAELQSSLARLGLEPVSSSSSSSSSQDASPPATPRVTRWNRRQLMREVAAASERRRQLERQLRRDQRQLEQQEQQEQQLQHQSGRRAAWRQAIAELQQQHAQIQRQMEQEAAAGADAAAAAASEQEQEQERSNGVVHMSSSESASEMQYSIGGVVTLEPLSSSQRQALSFHAAGLAAPVAAVVPPVAEAPARTVDAAPRVHYRNTPDALNDVFSLQLKFAETMLKLENTSDVCVHNYYNSQWEWISETSASKPNRVAMYMNTFRSRYADTVGINVLPGLVVMQIFVMGVVSLYEVMSHKRSVLLTQIWAYRCQNGTTQVMYLAQVAYHLIYNSELYLLGFSTGTLTTESLANLTCCFYAFSYSFINLAKSRSGDQQLDRHFRLTWEATQVVITACVVTALRVVQRNPIESIISTNAQILRKTSALGEEYCGLNDACIIFTVNTLTIITLLSALLGLIAVTTSLIVKKLSPKLKRVTSIIAFMSSSSARNLLDATPSSSRNKLTSFELNCLGMPFEKHFHDCDDIAYVTYNGKHCSTVEALLLTGYLYHGEHIYQASSVLLLVAARLLPQKLLRTFNVLILRWHLNLVKGTLTHALSCTWHTASTEKHTLNWITPVA
ncbi:putative transmembrane protein [Phytophthora cinnamomi]|uniref:putative transmembrane protein n=1 Tax=Phytophthora cinnamomi TaxID=4785 RepID=UPI00355A2BF7|nr:putative transmembrane protein [Phytophthora cinnamomi]